MLITFVPTIMNNSYPDCRLNAQQEYDQVARDYVHGSKGDQNINDRFEACLLLHQQRYGFAQAVYARSFKDFVIQRRKGFRKEQLAEYRAQLQQRYNEEVAFISEARDLDGRRLGLSPDLCKHIAGINNRTVKWDRPLKDPFLTKKKLDDPQDKCPRSCPMDIVQNPPVASGPAFAGTKQASSVCSQHSSRSPSRPPPRKTKFTGS